MKCDGYSLRSNIYIWKDVNIIPYDKNRRFKKLNTNQVWTASTLNISYIIYHIS